MTFRNSEWNSLHILFIYLTVSTMITYCLGKHPGWKSHENRCYFSCQDISKEWFQKIHNCACSNQSQNLRNSFRMEQFHYHCLSSLWPSWLCMGLSWVVARADLFYTAAFPWYGQNNFERSHAWWDLCSEFYFLVC